MTVQLYTHQIIYFSWDDLCELFVFSLCGIIIYPPVDDIVVLTPNKDTFILFITMADSRCGLLQ